MHGMESFAMDVSVFIGYSSSIFHFAVITQSKT